LLKRNVFDLLFKKVRWLKYKIMKVLVSFKRLHVALSTN